MKRKLVAALLVCAMCTSLAACGGGGDSGGDSGYRDEINIAVDVDAETYNPILTNNTTETGWGS